MAHKLFHTFASLFLVLAITFAGGTPAMAAPPSNDDIASATPVIEPLPFSDSINTVEATTAPDDPDCFGQGPTVWYAYTPSIDIRIVANTFGSDYDTTLSVYTGSPGSLTQIACNDDISGTLQSAVVIDVFAGQTYFFMVGAFASGAGGNLVFTVDLSPPPPTLDLTVDSVGQVDAHTGVATISGTYTCTDGDFVEIFVEASQKIGRFTISGSGGFFDLGTCDGTPHSWSAEVFPQNGKFAGGKLQTIISALSCGLGDCASAFIEQVVQLRGGRR